MEKKYNYLYKTTSKFNGKFYIGIHSTDDLDDGYMGSGSKLLKDIEKYGADRYEVDILEFFDSRSELVMREKEIVNKDLISNWFCLNLVEGGNEYEKGDKLYYTRWDQKKGGHRDTKFQSVIKEGEKRNIITNLLPYFKTIGWDEYRPTQEDIDKDAEEVKKRSEELIKRLKSKL